MGLAASAHHAAAIAIFGGLCCDIDARLAARHTGADSHCPALRLARTRGLVCPAGPSRLAGHRAGHAGALLRRWGGTHPFVFILGRAFAGTTLCAFSAASLSQLAGYELAQVETGLALVARWLMAWGDGVMTGMLAVIFVAFRPQWLATWSDSLYLKT